MKLTKTQLKQLVLTTDLDNISKKLLNKFAGITSLDLAWSDFENIDILVNFPNLTSLNLENEDSLQNVDGLANLPKLTSLDLTYCESHQPGSALE